jgi:tRNA pseudouridine55 synthase
VIDGLLLIDKEPDHTSHDVVQRVRRALRQKKVGHCGTLDPAATGLLLITLGKATRLTRFLIRAPKVYEGVMRFGIATDTYDAAGEVTGEESTAGLDQEQVEARMAAFVGTYDQAAPPYSAKKHAGVRYYTLARRGEEVPEARKPVDIFEFRALGPLGNEELGFRLGCSSGTYVRSLAHDLGRELGCGAHLKALRRLKIGPFPVEQAAPMESLHADLEVEKELGPAWIPLDEIPLPFGEVVTDQMQEQRIVHGQSVLVQRVPGEEGDWIKLVTRRHQLLAVGTVVERMGAAEAGVVQPRIVFR